MFQNLYEMDMFLSREPATDNNNPPSDHPAGSAATASRHPGHSPAATAGAETEQVEQDDPNGNPVACSSTATMPEEFRSREPKKELEDPDKDGDNWLVNFFTSPVSSPQESFPADPLVTTGKLSYFPHFDFEFE